MRVPLIDDRGNPPTVSSNPNWRPSRSGRDITVMHISRFRVQNYMIHRDTEVELPQIAVFVGENGGGKSALFDAMLNFSMISRGNISHAFGPYPYSYKATLYSGASQIERISFDVTMATSADSDRSFRYKISYAQNGYDFPKGFTIFDESLEELPSGNVLFNRSNPGDSEFDIAADLSRERGLFAVFRRRNVLGIDQIKDEDLDYIARKISQFNKFRLVPTVLAQPSIIPDTVGDEGFPPRIGYDGNDLSALLYYLSETESPVLAEITDRLKRVFTKFDRFEFNNVGNDRIAFSVVFTDGRKEVPSVRLSSGMLTFVGLVALVLQPDRPPVLMLEEPENGLTPQALCNFYEIIRATVERDKSSQIFISSHSPYVICEAWNGDDRDFIFQVKVDESGSAKIRKFSMVIEEQGIHLQIEDGERRRLGLKAAEEVMAGRFS